MENDIGYFTSALGSEIFPEEYHLYTYTVDYKNHTRKIKTDYGNYSYAAPYPLAYDKIIFSFTSKMKTEGKQPSTAMIRILMRRRRLLFSQRMSPFSPLWLRKSQFGCMSLTGIIKMNRNVQLIFSINIS